MIKILYCDDQTDHAQIVKACLEHSGFQVDHCLNGMEVLNRYQHLKPDIIILETIMPELDGFDVALQIRENDAVTPIIFASALTQIDDVLKGFSVGANDYIKKPFSVQELIARINVLVKNNPKAETKEYKIGRFIFDAWNKKLHLEGNTRTLSFREAELLKRLAENKNQLTNRKEVLEEIWQNEDFFTGRSMDVFVSRLRTYLREDDNVRIINVRKSGYIMMYPD